MIDLAFHLQGRTLPSDHSRALAAAVEAVLPWLTEEPGAGIHRLKLAHGSGQTLVSPRTRLVLRVPHRRSGDAQALVGRTLDIAGHALLLGRMQPHELLPWGTLYAHRVATAHEEETAFLTDVATELQQLAITARPISGRRQEDADGTLRGYSLMLDGLSAAHALKLLQHGIGAHRRLGCGLFVPHRSAAAVGTPP